MLLLFCHSVMSDSLTPWPVARQASVPFTIYLSLFKFTSIEPVMSSIYLILYCHFSCLQSFPTSGYFPMNRQFTSGSQRIGASTLASVLPMNIQGWFPLGLIGLISLLSKGRLRAIFKSKMLLRWKEGFIHQTAIFSKPDKSCSSFVFTYKCRFSGPPQTCWISYWQALHGSGLSFLCGALVLQGWGVMGSLAGTQTLIHRGKDGWANYIYIQASASIHRK